MLAFCVVVFREARTAQVVILFLLNLTSFTLFVISWPEPEKRQMVQQIVLQGSLLATTVMMVQIHLGASPDLAASVVIYGIGGAIMFISVSEMANLIRMGITRCRRKKLAKVEVVNQTGITHQSIGSLSATETFEEKKDTSMDM